MWETESEIRKYDWCVVTWTPQQRPYFAVDILSYCLTFWVSKYTHTKATDSVGNIKNLSDSSCFVNVWYLCAGSHQTLWYQCVPVGVEPTTCAFCAAGFQFLFGFSTGVLYSALKFMLLKTCVVCSYLNTRWVLGACALLDRTQSFFRYWIPMFLHPCFTRWFILDTLHSVQDLKFEKYDSKEEKEKEAERKRGAKESERLREWR